MDKIKTVKIKNPDGSVSEETYTISVDAKDVDMANGKELQETIGTIDIDTDGNIAEQLKNLNIDIKKKAYIFDTVADMRNANLKVGDYVYTLGYNQKNDEGDALYKIRLLNSGETYNNMNLIHLIDNLIAELVIPAQLNIRALGASPNLNNNIGYINKAFELSNNILISNGTFKTSYINITNNCVITGRNAGLEHVDNSDTNNKAIITATNKNITIEINNLILDCKTHNVNAITLSNITKLEVKNSIFKNIGLVGYSQGHNKSRDGMFLNKVTYCNINNCIFENIERDGVLGYPVLYLKLTNCIFNNCGRFPSANTQNDAGLGGEVANPIDTLYLNNYVSNCGSGGFDVEGVLNLAKTHFIISNNTIIDCGDNDWGYSWGIVAGNNSYGVISNNNIQNFALNSSASNRGNAIIVGTTGDDVIITNNTINNVKYRGIYIENSTHDLTISNNSIINAQDNGIFLSSQTYANIDGNIVKDCKKHGIYLKLSSGTHISNNSIKNCGLETDNTYDGIHSELCFNLNIIGNNISGSKHRYGFYLDSAAYKKQTNLIGNKIGSGMTNWFNFAPSNCPNGKIENGVTIMYAENSNALPNDGQWYVGDKIFLFDYTYNTYVGAVCTVSGTPGTWKRFGQIEQ